MPWAVLRKALARLSATETSRLYLPTSMPAMTTIIDPPGVIMAASSTLADAGPGPTYPFGATTVAGGVSNFARRNRR